MCFRLAFLPFAAACLSLPLSAQDTLKEGFEGGFVKFQTSPKDQRNAQNLSSVCSAAQVVGHDFVDGSEDKRTVAKRIIKGAFIPEGAFRGEFFGVPNMNDEDLQGALRHLLLRDGVLSYSAKALPLEGPPGIQARRRAQELAARRKAQEVVIECRSFQLKGIHDFVATTTDPAAVVAAIAKGVDHAYGHAGVTLSPAEQSSLLPYLTIEEGILKYTFRGQTEDPGPWLQEEMMEAAQRRTLRNATKLSSVCAQAAEAGLDFVQDATEVSVVVARVAKGATVPSGAFEGIFFGLPKLSPQHQREALPYLHLEDGQLRIDHTPEPATLKTAALSEAETEE